ncbi:oligosaccharide flippase family protein [Methanochimaera problematica]|uniref:oligosaccharide flippase family protein n=1 Tax=Methanochimaera problematica TaxID=2609417 RepID=UPI002938E151|nr:oligosaccharide flippase family protein [Methanoplanus sp. FWC-SCC4]
MLFIFSLILQRGAGVLTKLVLANSITPYEYGLITLVAISLPGMFQLLTNLNFYHMLSHSQEGKKYFGFTLVCSIFLMIIISVLLFFSSDVFFDYLNLPLEQKWLFYTVIVVSMFFMSIIIDFQGLFAGLKMYSVPSIIMALPSMVRLIVILLLFLSDICSFEIILFVFAISNAIPLLFIVFSRQHRKSFALIKSIKIPSKKIFAFGLSLFVVSSFSTIGQSIIKIVLSHNLGVTWQGYYDISLTLASLLLFSLGTMNYVSVPEATTSKKEDIYKNGGLGDVSRGLFSFMFYLIIVLYFYSEFIVKTLFSAEYVIASDYIFILAIGYLFLFIQNFLASLNLSFADKKMDYIIYTLIPLLILPLFFFLTEFLMALFKEYGYGNGFLGAYISCTSLYILFAIVTILFSKDLEPLKNLLIMIDKLIISSLATALVLYILNPPALIGLLLSAIIFSALTLKTGYIKKEFIYDLFGKSKK